MTASMAGVALAAGAGTRLSPITDTIPKPLCQVGERTLLDHALIRLATVDAEPAVNVHHGAELVEAEVAGRARVSHEVAQALGTAGALGRLRAWIDGRPTCVVNADTWCPGTLESMTNRWDGESVRVLVPGGGDFGPTSPIVGTLLPWRVVKDLAAAPTGLYEVVWSGEHDAGRLEVVVHDGPWMDCGTPEQLLKANLLAIGEGVYIDPQARVSGEATRSTVCRDATVRGQVSECLILPGGEVGPQEVLHRVIRWRRLDGAQQTIQV